MLRFFKSNSQLLSFLIPVFGIIIWLPVFLGKTYPISILPQLQPIGNILPWLTKSSLSQEILSYILLILLGFYLVRLNTKFQFIRFRTQLPAALAILMISPLAYYLNIFPVLLLSFPIIYAIERTFDSFAHDKLAFEFIDAAFMISAASFIFFPAIFLHILIILILIILKNNTWREWAFSLIGALIPFLIYLTLDFYFDWEYRLPFNALFKNSFNSFLPTVYGNSYLGYLALLLLLASLQMIRVFGVKKIQSRKLFIILFGLFIFGLLATLLPSVGVFGVVLALVPSSYLFAHYFHLLQHKKIGEILFILLLTSILLQEVMVFYNATKY